MDKIKLKFQFVLIGDFSSIDTSANTIKILLNELSEYGMIPTTFGEIKVSRDGSQQQAQRISFSNAQTGFIILFGLEKLDIIQQIASEDGSNIDDLETFIGKVKKILSSISKSFKKVKVFNKMALVTDHFMNIESIENKDSIYTNLINNPFDEPSKEWSLRIVNHVNSEKLDELINNIITIERVQGQIINKGQMKELDDIKLLIDINTDNRVNSFRFEIKNIEDFLDDAIIAHDKSIEKIESKLENQ